MDVAPIAWLEDEAILHDFCIELLQDKSVQPNGTLR